MTKIPPQNLEAEQSVLGGIMVDPDALDKIIDIINENDFYKSAHKKIFLAILIIRQKNQPVDLLPLTPALRASGEFTAIGELAYLATILISHHLRQTSFIMRRL